MDLEYLKALRLAELGAAEAILGGQQAKSAHTLRVLEIGAGRGWQAARMARIGYHVQAVDISTHLSQETPEFPVQHYDGEHLPFGAGEFDVIFTSNVLEHIPHVQAFQGEMRRVLNGTGIVVHILPSPTWRLWSNLTHYAYLVRALFALGSRRIASFGKQREASAVLSQTWATQRQRHSLLTLLKKACIPPVHGTLGNCVTEMYWFSVPHWRSFFRKSGWRIVSIDPVGIFYTGYVTFGLRLTLAMRKNLSRFLGSSCNVFVMEPLGTSEG